MVKDTIFDQLIHCYETAILWKQTLIIIIPALTPTINNSVFNINN